MTENKDLYEQYEEAFFAMLMDKIADAEGAELNQAKSHAASRSRGSGTGRNDKALPAIDQTSVS